MLVTIYGACYMPSAISFSTVFINNCINFLVVNVLTLLFTIIAIFISLFMNRSTLTILFQLRYLFISCLYLSYTQHLQAISCTCFVFLLSYFYKFLLLSHFHYYFFLNYILHIYYLRCYVVMYLLLLSLKSGISQKSLLYKGKKVWLVCRSSITL